MPHHIFKYLFRAVFISLAFSICLPPSALAEKPDLRFGVLADVQYADFDAYETRYYKNSKKKLKDCVKEFNSQNLDFVIHLGDMIDEGFENFDAVLSIYDKIKAPKYQVLGNHDYTVKDSEKAKVAEKLGMEKNYYSFSEKSWTFIVLDGNELSLYALDKSTPSYAEAEKMLNQLKKENKPQALVFNGGIGTNQIQWLEKTLKTACSANHQVVVFSHFPAYPESRFNLWNDTAVRKVLETHSCVLAYVNGHNHEGGYGEKNGIHYLTLQGMVETKKTNAYAIVEAYSDRLEIIGYGREPKRTLFKGGKSILKSPKKEKKEKKSKTKKKKEENMVTDFKLDPLEQSRAFQQYSRRSKSELSKLIFLMDRFKSSDISLIYDREIYDSDFGLKMAKKYIARHYRGEDARDWVQLHSYRSQHGGDIIFLKFPDGSRAPLRDILIQELKMLEKIG